MQYDWDATEEMAHEAQIEPRIVSAVSRRVRQYHRTLRAGADQGPSTFTGQTQGGEAMTHLNNHTVDQHERAMVEQDQDQSGWVIVYGFAMLVFATGVLVGYGLALLVVA
jgi:hypothetical protein